MKGVYQYWGSCMNSTGEDIEKLRRWAREVTWKEFKKAIPDARHMLQDAGAISDETTDKQIEDSWFLDFFRSEHRGRPAYFISWSGIEWIWERVDWDWDANPRRSVVRGAPDMLADIIALYELGVSQQDIADRYGVSQSTVSKWLREAGADTRTHHPARKHIDEIVELYRSGESLRGIAKKFGVSHEAIRALVIEAGEEMRPPASFKHHAHEHLGDIVELYESGVSQQDIADRYGVSQSTVSKWLREAGADTRTHHPARKHIDEIVELYRSGESLRGIAKKFGVSHEVIRLWLKEASVELRPKKMRKKLTDAQEAKLVRVYKEGASLETAGEMFGVSAVTAAKILDRHGEARRPPGRPKSRNPSRSVFRGALGIASITATLVGLGFAIRALRMKERRDPGPGQTSALGNSITAARFGFVSFLDRSLPQRSFTNMGVVGEGTVAIKRRLERDVLDQGFDEVIIEAGMNDIGRRDATTYIPSQLEAMVRSAKRAGLKVVLVTLTPYHEAVGKIAAVNDRIRSQGRHWGADVVVDIHRPLADWRGHLRQELVGDRMGLHPNRQGQELIGRTILEAAYS